MRIALYLNILNEEYQIAIYRGIRESAEELGIDLVCVQDETIDERSNRGRHGFPLPQYLSIDGILLLTSVLVSHDDQFFQGGIKRQFPGLPVVAVGNGLPGIPSVLIRGDDAMRRLMAHLIDAHGYRRFLFLGGQRGHRDSGEREAVFRVAIGKAGARGALEGTVAHSNITDSGAAAIIRSLIAETGGGKAAPIPEAIVAASDNMAIGALRAIRESGNAAWQACAVTGFDDIPQAALEVPALTTARQPYALAGKIAVETLSALVEGREAKDSVTIEAVPIIRASCGCADILAQSAMGPGENAAGAVSSGTADAVADDALATPRERLALLHRQRARSERLLRSVSILGQRLATVGSIPEIMPQLEDFLAEIGARAFFLALFPPGTVSIPDRCLPAYAYENGGKVPFGEADGTMRLADFFSRAICGESGATVSRSVYQLAAGQETPGVLVYEVEDDVLPHMCTSAVFIANTVKRLYVLDIEKEHSRKLEREVKLRTRDLSETNRKLAEEAERRKEVEAEVLRIGELERQRFSLDLHDDICQRLAGISMFCKSLAPDPTRAKAITEIAEMIDETLARTRQYAHDSFPVELDSLGLRDALESLCATVSRQTGCDCAFSWESAHESPLGRARDINVYRIVQEALANAVRHSRASLVEVSVRTEPDSRLFVRIKDNGKGNPDLERDGDSMAEKGDRRRGLGLKSMRYRARQIGASYRIQSSAEGGTLIEIGLDLTPGE
ncbi:MAG TPA: substrate-binding domain-containing protein [Treponemataceae bacterium]|nr:substrate-binding domain-containing protein [Treponemataceae bacterium]